MRDTCNQSVKKAGRQSSSELGEGGKKADAAKRIFKEREGVENPGGGAAGALVFLGINVTELLLDQGNTENQ